MVDGRQAAGRGRTTSSGCSCSVSDQCLLWAMTALEDDTTPANLRFGIFGGLTPKERAELARTPAGLLAASTTQRAS